MSFLFISSINYIFEYFYLSFCFFMEFHCGGVLGFWPITFHAPGSTAAIFNKTYAEINSLYGRQASAEAAASIVTGLQKGFVNCFARTRHLLVEDGMEVAGGVRGTDWFARRLGGTTRSRGKFAPFLFSDCSDYDPGGAAATATWRSRPGGERHHPQPATLSGIGIWPIQRRFGSVVCQVSQA